jgi:hypothetical protein
MPVVVGEDPTLPSTLEVCVRAALTQEALGGATVVVDSETGLHERIETADRAGRAEFKGLPAGEYRVTVYYSSHLERRLREVLESERVGVDVDIPLPSGHAGGGQACSSESASSQLAPAWRR